MDTRGLLLLLLIALPAAGLASDFSGYRIPPSAWRRYGASFEGDASRASSVTTGRSSRDSHWRGSVTGSFSVGRDSDPRRWDITLRGGASGERMAGDTDEYRAFPETGMPVSTLASTSRSRDRLLREDLQLLAGARFYPWPAAVGIEGRGSLAGRYSQSWLSDRGVYETSGLGVVRRTEFDDSQVRSNYLEEAGIEAGLGYGRVRDASPVFLAVLLEERLTRDRVVIRPISSAARTRLAELFSLRGQFDVVHDLPGKFFWGEVERLLREDGALGEGGLDGYSAMHADEGLVVARSGFVRNAGWFAGPVLSASHRHELVRIDDAISARSVENGVPQPELFSRSGMRAVSSEEALWAGGRVEWHVPLDTRTQLDFAEEALVEFAGTDEGLSVSGVIQAQRLVGERWLATGSARHSRSIQGERPVYAYWSTAVSAGVSYFLEDLARLDLGLDHFQLGSEQGLPVSYRQRRNDLRLRLGVSVTRGGLESPALFAPLRPLR